MHVRGYEATRLWDEAFQPEAHGINDHFRARLRASYALFYDRAAVLAGEIPRDLATYTVHDVTHLDALWGVADMLAGATLHLNPLEAYVLGGAILTHDLGMSAAAYVNGDIDLEKSASFADAVAVLHGPEVAAASLTSQQRSAARAWALRENHAEQAALLPTQGWRHVPDDTTLHLIEDTDLRIGVGPVIGRLAQSHWWSIEKVNEVFSREMGAPVGFPRTWTIDLFKVAILLRAADAAQVDATRAPTFLYTLRHLSGLSELHWRFQNKLNAPFLRNERLEYSARVPFARDEADAWWLCFDALSMVHQELQNIESYLSSRRSEYRLTARGVSGANDPLEFARAVEVSGWTPIDARPTISDVAALIEKLGGDALYGRDDLVPVRELMQNGIDAAEAMSTIDQEFRSRAGIAVSLQESEGSAVLSVSDSGIGMSKGIIIHALLDFGSSIWKSTILRRELPQLLRKTVKIAGRFGIGFFSVFMLGDRVRVVTRKFDVGPNETLVLQFESGLKARPLLRPADDDERLWSSGTVVSINLDRQFIYPTGMRDWLSEDYAEPIALTDKERFPLICQYLVPLPTIPYSVTYGFENAVEVSAVDWRTAEPRDLFCRTVPRMETLRANIKEVELFVDQIRPILNEEGVIVGRAALTTSRYANEFLGAVVITDTGVRLTAVEAAIGVFLGDPTRAARDSAKIRAPHAAISAWATEQGILAAARTDLSEKSLLEFADRVATLEGDLGGLPIAYSNEGYLNSDQTASWISRRPFFIMSHTSAIERDTVDPVSIGDNVLLTTFTTGFLRDAMFRNAGRNVRGGSHHADDARFTLAFRIAKMAATVWNIREEDLAAGARGVRRGDYIRSVIGTRSVSGLLQHDQYTRAYRRDAGQAFPESVTLPIRDDE